MKFLWPQMLWLLTTLPVMVGAYVVVLGRRQRTVLRYAQLGLIRDAMGARHSLRRHLPALLVLIGIGAMLVSVARPSALVVLPSHHETVILAMDVSSSMRAEDVPPNRLAAAQAAAHAFIAEQPRTTRIGIVEFSGSASLVQAPTTSREDLARTIDGLMPQNATAIGAAIMVSLKALFPDMEFDLSASSVKPANYTPAVSRAPGAEKSAAIILLTDGQNTSGPAPLDAAQIAAQRGVRVYTVGFGSDAGEIAWGPGASMRVALDERTLRGVAELTGAEYFHAGSASELKSIYSMLHANRILERKSTEVGALFCAAAVVTLVLGALLSLLWFNRA